MYLLSVIIPTRNRIKFCIESVKQILSVCNAIDSGKIEIVIQDNSDNDGLREEIEKLGADNIRYNYNGKVISFVDNFSEAVSLATGEYLCMIGDDDGILPNIIDAVKLAEEKKVKAIIPALNVVYIWPMKESFVKNGENGYLYFSKKNPEYKLVKCGNALPELMKNGGQEYQKYGMPRLYHGIVHRELLEKIECKTGNYFGGLTPDIYMAVALSFVCDKALRLNYPVTISGVCSGSGSANSATGKHTGKLSDAPHFIGHESYEWSKEVPEIYTVETIWADTALHAVEDFNAAEKKNFSIKAMISVCYFKYPQFRTELENFRKKHGISICSVYITAMIKRIRYFVTAACGRFKRNKYNFFRHYNVENISAAEEIVRKTIL